MQRSIANWLGLGLALAVAPLLAACGSECTGCGASCPVKAGTTFDLTLLSTGLPCKNLPVITNTLAQLAVVELSNAGTQTRLTLRLTSFAVPLDIGLAGNLCTSSGNPRQISLNATFLQRKQLAGGSIATYTLNGTIAAEQDREPTASGTLLMTYSDPAAPADLCSTQATFSPI